MEEVAAAATRKSNGFPKADICSGFRSPNPLARRITSVVTYQISNIIVHLQPHSFQGNIQTKAILVHFLQAVPFSELEPT